MAAKFFTGLPLDGPDPECVLGHGEHALAAPWPRPLRPSPSTRPLAAVARRAAGGPASRRRPDRACDESPLAALRARPRPPAEPMARLVDPVAVAGRTAPSRVVFGPHETNLGRGRGHQRPARRLLPGAGRRRGRRRGHRDGLGPPVGLALRAGPAGRAVRAGLGRGGRGLPSPRHPGAGRAGPRRRPGVERLLAVGAVGARRRWPTWSAARCRWPWSRPDIDAAGRRLRRRRPAGRGRRASTGWRSTPAHSRSSASSTPGSPTSAPTPTAPTACGSPPRCCRRAGGRRARTRCCRLRLCCDELAPWAGVTPEQAAEQVGRAGRAGRPVGGGPGRALLGLRLPARRPHPGRRSTSSCARQMREAAGGPGPVVLQGSVVDPAMAQAALDDGAADLVEMTRAQIAEPRLVALVRAGDGRTGPALHPLQPGLPGPRQPQPAGQLRGRAPQRSRDGRADPVERTDDDRRRDVLVVGAGVAGLECARVLAGRGHRVGWRERSDRAGGALRRGGRRPGPRAAGRAGRLAESPSAAGLGVTVETGVEVTPAELDAARADGVEVVLATGARAGAARPFPVDGSVPGGRRRWRCWPGASTALPDGPVVVHDPVGGPIGVGVAEWLAGAGRDGGPGHAGPDRRDPAVPDRRPGRRQHPAAAGRGAPRAPGRCSGASTTGRPTWRTCGPASDAPIACAVAGRLRPPAARGVPLPGPARHPAGRRLRGPAQRARGRARGPAPGPRRSPAAPPPAASRSRREPAGDATGRPSATAGPGRVAGQGGPDHRGRPGPGPQPRRAAGRRGRRHHRRRPLRRRRAASPTRWPRPTTWPRRPGW